MTSEKQESDGESEVEKTRSLKTVNSRHCLWFAWAPGTISLQVGDMLSPDDEDCRPRIVIDVEGGYEIAIDQVDLSARWRHGPEMPESDANGLPDKRRNLKYYEYKSPEYRSEGIVSGEKPLNMLVGIFEFNNEVPTPSAPSQIEEIGMHWTHRIPDGATKLFLGFHDGYEWCNNCLPDGQGGTIPGGIDMEFQVTLTRRRQRDG